MFSFRYLTKHNIPASSQKVADRDARKRLPMRATAPKLEVPVPAEERPDLLDAVAVVESAPEVFAEHGVDEERGEALHQAAPDLPGQAEVAFLLRVAQ